MQYRWIGKKIHFALLKVNIEDFLRDRSLRFKHKQLSDGFSFFITPFDGSKLSGAVVSVIGKPEDFVISFETSPDSRTYRLLSSFAALIGAGGLLVRGSKVEDRLKELEKDFWAHIGEWLAQSPNR